MISLINILAEHSVEGVDLKSVMMILFVLVVIGAIAWFVSTKPIPTPFNWLIYFVLAAVGVVICWRFLQGL